MIDIVLATYNGAPYLPAQLDSLLQQDCGGWRLLVRDDGSSDQSAAILQSYAERFPGKIRVLANSGGNLGACGNFAELLRSSDADYTMLCDQDDVWLPDKVGRTLAEMQRLEAECGKDSPVLVHTDFRVVDEQLRVVAESGWRFQKTDPTRSALNQLLVQNVATGCTVMINRALREIALPIPPEALMHDWWLALVASAFGRIGCLRQSTMLYRQHGGNKVGAQDWGVAYLVSLVAQLALIRAVMARNRSQAKAFCAQYSGSLAGGQETLLEVFFSLPERGWRRRRLDVIRHGIFYAGTVRNIGWLLLC